MKTDKQRLFNFLYFCSNVQHPRHIADQIATFVETTTPFVEKIPQFVEFIFLRVFPNIFLPRNF